MKNNYRRLQLLLKIFGCESFYSCEFTKGEVYCQGKFDTSVLSKADQYRFKIHISAVGNVALTRGNYKIVLTA
jgi:hypothetical protein